MNKPTMHRTLGALMFAVFSTTTFADPPPPVLPKDDSTVLPDSFARQQFKRLPKETLDNIARDATKGAQFRRALPLHRADSSSNSVSTSTNALEAITVYGSVAPEDYTAPKPSPMMVFRATLDKQRPSTPKEITLGLLCVIGLCAVDTSRELDAADRAEAKAKAVPDRFDYRK